MMSLGWTIGKKLKYVFQDLQESLTQTHQTEWKLDSSQFLFSSCAMGGAVHVCICTSTYMDKFKSVHRYVWSPEAKLHILLNTILFAEFIAKSLTEFIAHYFCQTAQLESSRDLPISDSPFLGLQACSTGLSFYADTLESNTRSQAYIASTLSNTLQP